MKITAIVLAGGAGKRMQSTVPKQYMEVCGHPVLYYTLKAFEESCVDDIVLVTADGEENRCMDDIVRPAGFAKTGRITKGGNERYLSVYNGLKACGETDIVMIHDGARCLVTPGLINKVAEMMTDYSAVIAAVPVKDTIKVVGTDMCIKDTPDRSSLFCAQTPQCFRYRDILAAYEKMFAAESGRSALNITDDSMIMENFSNVPVHLAMGEYTNIKVTTPEDLETVRGYLEKNQKKSKKSKKSY